MVDRFYDEWYCAQPDGGDSPLASHGRQFRQLLEDNVAEETYSVDGEAWYGDGCHALPQDGVDHGEGYFGASFRFCGKCTLEKQSIKLSKINFIPK